MDQVPSEEQPEETAAEERNRATAVSENPRQDWTGLDFSGQHMKALSPMLFRYDFLSKLYLDHNDLERLDPAIGQLRNLTHFDISNNSIRELPEEIGMLVNLRELLIFDNKLHTLPVQLGHLFKLEMLGIEGNSIIEEIRDIVMHQGTKALVTQFREHYPRKKLHFPSAILLVCTDAGSIMLTEVQLGHLRTSAVGLCLTIPLPLKR